MFKHIWFAVATRLFTVYEKRGEVCMSVVNHRFAQAAIRPHTPRVGL
jgi:hypothetical protein